MKRRTGYLFRRGDNWYVSWKVNGKPNTKALRDAQGQPITSRREAVEARDAFMAPMTVADEAAVLKSIAGRLDDRKGELAKWEEVNNPPLPISQTWGAFLKSPSRPDSGAETLYQYECQWSQFADWIKETRPELTALRDVTADVAAKYFSSEKFQMLSAGTYNKHRNLLTLVFHVLKKEARIADNPWEDITLKKLPGPSRRELTIDELKRVCSTATGELRILLAVGIYTGMRLGDAATLTWGEVDLQRGRVVITPNKTSRRHPDRTLKIPIHPFLHGILAETPAEKRGGYIMPGLADLYAKRIDAVTDIVQGHFKSNGIQVHRSGTGKGKIRAVVEVGFHSLRHSFVSLCANANAPLSVVQSLVGHGSPAMTQHYTHSNGLADTQAIALLPAMSGDNTTEKKPLDADAILAEVKAIAESMEKKNWREKRAALMTLVTDGQSFLQKPLALIDAASRIQG